MEIKKCVICGFDKNIQKHHIVKYKEYGSNNENNLVYLCPNHHWMADFGSEEDKDLIKELIIDICEKYGEKDFELEKYYDKLIRADEENFWGEFTEEQWLKHKNTQNYEISRNYLRNRNVNEQHNVTKRLKMMELIYINKLIKLELKTLGVAYNDSILNCVINKHDYNDPLDKVL